MEEETEAEWGGFDEEAVGEEAEHKAELSAHKGKKKKKLNPAVGFLLLFVMLVSGAWCGYAAVNAFLLPSGDQNIAGMDQERNLLLVHELTSLPNCLAFFSLQCNFDITLIILHTRLIKGINSR